MTIASSNPSSDPRSVVVLVIDRLSAGSLGPYGNTSIDTPEFNQWAASGVLFDHVIANTVELDSAYDAFWSEGSTWLNAGSNSILLTDEPKVASQPSAESFQQVQLIEQTPKEASAASAADTQLANFFAQATESLSSLRPGGLLWLHSRGMSGLWDAPYAYRQMQCGPDDPAPPDFVNPPSCCIDAEDADPDLLLGFEQAYAAQVLLLDRLLNVLNETLNQDSRFADTWFVLTSPRGYPLGQHGIVGNITDLDFAGTTLHQENLHVPLIVCPPAKLTENFSANRCGQVISTDSVAQLIAALHSGSGKSYLRDALNRDDEDFTQFVISRCDRAKAIQARNWKLITDGQQNRLYAKPDDRWEVNDVADRCTSEVSRLLEIANVSNSSRL